MIFFEIVNYLALMLKLLELFILSLKQDESDFQQQENGLQKMPEPFASNYNYFT
jgi:hypothetical protein